MSSNVGAQDADGVSGLSTRAMLMRLERDAGDEQRELMLRLMHEENTFARLSEELLQRKEFSGVENLIQAERVKEMTRIIQAASDTLAQITDNLDKIMARLQEPARGTWVPVELEMQEAFYRTMLSSTEVEGSLEGSLHSVESLDSLALSPEVWGREVHILRQAADSFTEYAESLSDTRRHSPR